MALTTNKKVLLVRFDRETLAGFVQVPGGFAVESIELLTPSGALLQVPYSDTKVVCFVRDFDTGENWREHRSFSTRPKSHGLWVRMLFRDGDELEGMIPNNLLQIEPAGFSILPISGLHAAKVGGLPSVHRDPFDRMLVAQALIEPMILLTNDRVLASYGPFVSVA